MTTMVLEYADPPTVGVTWRERKIFSDLSVPPDNWAIWVAKYDGVTPNPSSWHIAFRSHNPADFLLIGSSCNAQITTFNLGKGLFHCFSYTGEMRPNFPENFHKNLGLHPIWPRMGRKLVLTGPSLNDEAAALVIWTIRSRIVDSFG